MFCLLVALGQLSGGAISQGPQNLAENILLLLALLAGSVIWAIVQGVVCGIITVGDPQYIEHRQNMDQLNFLMGDMGVNQEVRALRPSHVAHADAHARHAMHGMAAEHLSARASRCR